MKYWGNIGIWVCKVFGKVVGMIGLSVYQFDEISGSNYDWVIVYLVNYVGYYFGLCWFMVKIYFDFKNGKLFGGQVIGLENVGVDKQIDVLVVVLMVGMMVEDLEYFELVYVFFFGSVKDVVNMVGFVVGNVLRGDVEIVYVVDFVFEMLKGRRKSLEDYFLLDVWLFKEFVSGYIDGVVNIFLGDLRKRLDEVFKDKFIISYCQVGYWGYLGYRILKQDGYDVVNLDGGYCVVFEGGFDDGLKFVVKRWVLN